MFAAAKDKITSSLAQKFLNTRFERYGKITALHLDSQKNRVEFAGTLLGEYQPFRLVVERYTLRKEAGKTLVHVDALSCDRPWLENLLQDLTRDQWLELPGWAAAGL